MPLLRQLGPHDLLHMRVGKHAPRQIQARDTQAHGVPAQAGMLAPRQRHAQADQQRQGVQRVDDEHAAHRVGVLAEWLEQLGAVDRQGVEQGVGEQREPQRQAPSPEQAVAAMQAVGHPGQQRRCQGDEEQAVAFGAVVSHVADRIAKVDQRIQVRQRARDAAPQRRLPYRGAPPHDGDAARGAEAQLRE